MPKPPSTTYQAIYKTAIRRANGVVPRTEYEKQAKQRRLAVIQMRENDIAFAKIAKQLQCSKAEAIRLSKKL